MGFILSECGGFYLVLLNSCAYTPPMDRRLYNLALAQRQWFYDEWKISRSYADQSGWFKDEREDNRWFAAINFSSAQATVQRLDKAFANFFRRVKAGETPGYPRFKGRDRFNSILYPSHGDGIRLKGN